MVPTVGYYSLDLQGTFLQEIYSGVDVAVMTRATFAGPLSDTRILESLVLNSAGRADLT